ncbi:unnamed protein product [Brachionus calyciflorus]|uniref:RNA-directed DNA polymerase from mobile element jockey-like n=1 Tax=Brachionus calyciflorus TaxID=104777 RepID=A0A813N6F9_9BILA|nr:unnamed protein product [Brachionus calyciflorus]
MCEKDLGIFIKHDMKWDVQVRNSTSKANRILGMIKKTFKYLDIHNTSLLYKALVRPHLEYAISSWSPYSIKDVKELEKVQRRATRLTPQLRGLSSPDRLSKMGLSNLQTRRQRGDLIQMFKIVNNFEKVDLINCGYVNAQNRKYNLRSHNKSIRREKMRYFQPRFNFLNNRVTALWNKLPIDIVNTQSLNSFKAKLDVWMESNVSSGCYLDFCSSCSFNLLLLYYPIGSIGKLVYNK